MPRKSTIIPLKRASLVTRNGFKCKYTWCDVRIKNINKYLMADWNVIVSIFIWPYFGRVSTEQLWYKNDGDLKSIYALERLNMHKTCALCTNRHQIAAIIMKYELKITKWNKYQSNKTFEHKLNWYYGLWTICKQSICQWS